MVKLVDLSLAYLNLVHVIRYACGSIANILKFEEKSLVQIQS